MENKKKSGAAGEKSFYVVLALCAAVIGVSAWILMSDVGTNKLESAETMVDIPEVVVTTVPAGTPMEQEEQAETEPELDLETLLEETQEESQETESNEVQEVFSETVTSYVWPVQGEIETPYSVQTLLYDATMADWRVHDGIDIACDLGTQVMASAGGTVVRVEDDDLAGTVVEIDHANGVHTIYTNLAQQPPVAEGDVVTMGQVIGSVGGTALGETNVVPHLHFAMTYDGRTTDPTEYMLQAEWLEN
jgi:murein DD-endopeptidase MepM/ murein hydrolase activator NlpD